MAVSCRTSQFLMWQRMFWMGLLDSGGFVGVALAFALSVLLLMLLPVDLPALFLGTLPGILTSLSSVKSGRMYERS